MTEQAFRLEHDSMGDVRVPAERLYGAQTQRAVNNFYPSGLRLPADFIQALGLIKGSAARVNTTLGELDEEIGNAIFEASEEVRLGQHPHEFPVDVFQTGSGTSTNMNVNEVIATRASQLLGRPVHPNDHVNRGQSSNDVIPTAIQLSALLGLRDRLYPACDDLIARLNTRIDEFTHEVKIGRTHLMDAMPLTVGQEFSGWRDQIADCGARLRATESRLFPLAIGGTAVGTGVNTHREFARRVARHMAESTRLPLEESTNHFRDLSSQGTSVELSGQLRTLAVALMKIANDIRWMNSGPLAGLGEIQLPALQPGSSIMPAKVNPVIAESICMMAAKVMGNDTTIAIAGQSGTFQLNVMLPVIAHDLLQSIDLLANATRRLAEQVITHIELRTENLQSRLAAHPILVTALAPHIGYELATEIGKYALSHRLPILDAALEKTDLGEEQLRVLLDPARLTGPDATG